MFEIDMRAEPVAVEWQDDGSGACLLIDIDQLRIEIGDGERKRRRLRLALTRNAINWLWGNLDREIVLELFRVQRDGGISPRLQEIARALGLEEDGGQH